MPLPVRLSTHHPASRWAAALIVALLSTALAVLAHHLPGISLGMSRLDETLYDTLYHLRKQVDRTDSDVVIVAVDDASLANMARNHRFWPWPRDYWGILLPYMQKCGARAVVFDLIFTEPSALSQFMDDDAHFGEALDQTQIPVVMGTIATDSGEAGPFAIPTQKPPVFGAVNILTDKTVRSYPAQIHGMPSLAVRTLQSIGAPIPWWANDTFRLHYYGPSQRKDGHTTFRYLSAAYVFADAVPPKKGKPARPPVIAPSTFKDKVVLVGAISAGTYDLKSSPLSALYPGVEVQATAIEDLLNNQRVVPIGEGAALPMIFLAAVLAALGVTVPRGVMWKVFCVALTAGALVVAASVLFTRSEIHWLPMSSPILVLLLAVLGAFAWTYLAEERQRRFFVKALEQYLSPEVAAEIQRDPSKLKLGGQRREMTVMFSDIQGFTTLSETMPSEKLSALLNYYLGEMSSLILDSHGTIDKYIGDAIMSFWNAPLLQPDHAIRACRAALQMRQREAEIQPALRTLGAPELITRIGINTGPMAFGNMGSPQKFNYSVLGDSVNLGSRLEGANKLYDSRILLAQSTVDSIGSGFIVRQLDLLAVKGKLQPMAVYELMDEAPGNADLLARVELYERALGFYRQQNWNEAQSTLNEAHTRYPDDAPVLALSRRIDYLRLHPPAPDWDGVYVAKDKQALTRMIAAITGELRRVDDDRISLQLGPILYELLVAAADVPVLQSSIGRELTFYTIFYLEGDSSGGNMEPRLVGFLRSEDKAFFQQFITVKGIGPKKALRALTLPVGEIAHAIEGRDTRVLIELPGIGKRMAEQIVAELAGKVERFAVKGAKRSTAVAQASSRREGPEEDAIQTLMTLGEKRMDAEALLDRAKRADETLVKTDALVREMLRLRTSRG